MTTIRKRLGVLKHNIFQTVISIDQVANGLIGIFAALWYVLTGRGRGELYYADETISSHSYRWDIAKIRAWPRKAIDTLLCFDKDHCKTSFEGERLRLQAPPETRK